jgi:hypothetical protein
MAYTSIKSVLKGSDDGILQLLLLDFRTFSTVWYSEKSTTFQKLGLFLSPCEKMGNTYSVGSLPSITPGWLFRREPSEYVFSTFSHQDQNRASFQNIMFLSEYQMMDRVQKFLLIIFLYVIAIQGWEVYATSKCIFIAAEGQSAHHINGTEM